MKKIYLTVGINADEEIFKSYSGFERINLGMLSCNKTKEKDGLLIRKRAQCIFEHISSFPHEFYLIGYGMTELNDYLELKRLLDTVGIKIDKVFVSKKSSRKDIHEKHSNWTGYSPSDIEYMDDIYFGKLDILLDALKSDGVEVIILFN